MRPPPSECQVHPGRVTVVDSGAGYERTGPADAGEPEERSVPPRTSPNGTALLHLGPTPCRVPVGTG